LQFSPVGILPLYFVKQHLETRCFNIHNRGMQLRRAHTFIHTCITEMIMGRNYTFYFTAICTSVERTQFCWSI